MKTSFQLEPMDEAAFQNSFMMEGFGIPDIASYQDRCQYTLTETEGNAIYRLYLMDNETWLARIHKDSVNKEKSEYIWSIFQIERFAGEIPLTVSIFGTQDGVEEFLSLLGHLHPDYEPNACYNITQDIVGENPDYSVFKFNTSCASFLLYENRIYPMGEWFGGFGVTSMALHDLNEDGKQELYFTYSFGSGLHRSHIAYFDPALKQVVHIEYMHLNKDMMVAANLAGGLSLYDTGISSMDSFVQFEMKSAGYIADIVYESGKIGLSPTPQE